MKLKDSTGRNGHVIETSPKKEKVYRWKQTIIIYYNTLAQQCVIKRKKRQKLKKYKLWFRVNKHLR